MRVADIIQSHLVSISENAPLSEGARLIFNLGIGALPVVKGKKLIGILTGHDILTNLYPTVQDFVEDFAHARNFENMEQNLRSLLDTPVAKIMNRALITVTLQTPLMQAQSLMLLHRFSHLPIVNPAGELIGIISQGDIFRQLMKSEMPRLEQERYAGFVAACYDRRVNWEKWNQRFDREYPILDDIFKKNNIHSLIDLGLWTGEYALRLARRGHYQILGLDHNPVMIKICEEKKAELPRQVRQRLRFSLTNFTHLDDLVSEKADAAVCLGNALPYIPVPSINKLFAQVASLLRRDNALFIIQLRNFAKMLKTKNHLLSFNLQSRAPKSYRDCGCEKEYLSIEFFDKNKKGHLLHHIVIFDSDGRHLIFKGATTVAVKCVTRQDIEKALKKAGFDRIVFAGYREQDQEEYGRLSFDKPFDEEGDDWLHILARR